MEKAFKRSNAKPWLIFSKESTFDFSLYNISLFWQRMSKESFVACCSLSISIFIVNFNATLAVVASKMPSEGPLQPE